MNKTLKRSGRLAEDNELDVVLMEEGGEDMANLSISEDEEVSISAEVKLDSFLDQDDIEFLQQHRKVPEMSFDKLDPDKPELSDEIEYKARTVRVNNLLAIRKPVVLTPSMCRAVGCNYDATTVNGFPDGWESVPENRRHIFLRLKEKHFAKYHGNIESHIIKHSQLPKRWLRKTGYNTP